jgi:hypothetical protein
VWREDIYESWVPRDGAWSLFARPVLFAQMIEREGEPSGESLGAPGDISWAPPVGSGAVLVIDLPGEESVLTGLALAARGYRPVPVYNVCTGPNEVIDQKPILRGLVAGAAELVALRLPADAPPAFLLDSRRPGFGFQPQPHSFDNRWKVFPQDFPSARLLAARGFSRVLLVQRGQLHPQEDLTHVLRRWQDAGLVIEAKNVASDSPPAPITVERPAWYLRAWYRILTILGLKRGPHGGYGGEVPEPSHG